MTLRQPTIVRCQFRQEYLIDEVCRASYMSSYIVLNASSIVDDAFFVVIRYSLADDANRETCIC